jgi:hypothetical protein
MSNDANARCADQPQDGADRRSPDTQRNGNDQKTSVELRGGCAGEPNVEIRALELADSEHATDYEHNDEEQEQVREQAVDAEHDEDDSIIAAKVGQVVVDASLDLAKVLRFGHAFEVEELADGLEVGKAVAESLRADALEAAAQVEAAGESLIRDVHASHAGGECKRASLGVPLYNSAGKGVRILALHRFRLEFHMLRRSLASTSRVVVQSPISCTSRRVRGSSGCGTSGRVRTLLVDLQMASLLWREAIGAALYRRECGGV